MQGDRAQTFVTAFPLTVGAALEQHRSSGDEIIPKFLSQFCNYHFIQYELFTVNYHFRVNDSK